MFVRGRIAVFRIQFKATLIIYVTVILIHAFKILTLSVKGSR